MKKIYLLGWIVLLSLVLTTPVLAQSSTQEPEPTPSPVAQEDTYTFPLLGFTETRLIGPFDSTGIQVSFPEEWTFPSDGLMHLEYSLSFFGNDYVPGQGLIGGVLDVDVNGTVVATFSLSQEGDYTGDIRIPASALISERTDGRMQITFNLISEESCVRDFDVNLVVKETSYLYLPHGLTSPQTDLTLLPRPFYQPSSLIERTAILVLPDNPSTAELQAGLDVSAGFGSLTGGDLLLNLVTFSNLTSEMVNSENLILVGKASSLSLINDLNLPAASNGSSYSLGTETDGILQMIVSPWNSSRAVLLVSGNSDEGVIKAGQAVKYGTILTTTNNNVSVVEMYRTEASAPLAATDRSFLELGYEDRTMRSTGTNYATYEFYIPPGQTVSSDSYLDLHFNHSALLSFDTSGISIILNGRVISSVKFSEETTQFTKVQINLPPSAFIQGTNELQIQVQIIPYDSCTDMTNFVSAWATIFNDSNLHLPLVADTGSIVETLNLSGFPENLALGAAQGNVVFILPENAPNIWKSAATVAFKMGDQLDAALSQINVQFENTLNLDELADRNVVLFGKPSQLPLVYDWSDSLPAPFEAGSEVPFDPASRIVYRIVEGSNVGYIELFTSPWGTDKTVMLVSGNTEDGVSLASSALAGGDFRGSLAGNFAIISSGQIISLDTRYPVSSELLDSQLNPIEETTAQNQPAEVQKVNMTWMIPAIIVITVATVVLILIKLNQALKKSKKGSE